MKSQIEAAKIIKKYMEEKNKQLAFAFFHKFSTTMFAQLSIHLQFKKMQLGEVLYKQGDPCRHFYFVVKGRITIQSKDDGVDYSTKAHGEDSFFGISE